MDPRVPFRKRIKGEEDDWKVLIEGVPPHLQASLKPLIHDAFYHDDDLRGILHRRLRLSASQIPSVSVFTDLADRDLELYLEIIEFLVQEIYAGADRFNQGISSRHDSVSAAMFLINVQRIFQESNSAYQFVEYGNIWTLNRRVDSTVTEALNDAILLNPEAGELLREAWHFCFQREPNYRAAYDRAILGVESVATKLFIPNDPTPTLGKAISHLESTSTKWSISGLDSEKQQSSLTLLAMLRTMWTAQGRHVEQGGLAPTPTQREEAESIIFLAISIVQLFSRGLIPRS